MGLKDGEQENAAGGNAEFIEVVTYLCKLCPGVELNSEELETHFNSHADAYKWKGKFRIKRRTKTGEKQEDDVSTPADEGIEKMDCEKPSDQNSVEEGQVATKE